jgi:hypothetical protein
VLNLCTNKHYDRQCGTCITRLIACLNRSLPIVLCYLEKPRLPILVVTRGECFAQPLHLPFEFGDPLPFLLEDHLQLIDTLTQ